MDKEALRRFLIDSNKAGYATGEENMWKKEPNGSTSIPFEKSPWRSHDDYFGGEPYGGRVVVFYKGKPVWLMVYYGWVAEDIATDPVYKVLRNALMRMPEDHPFRGPKEYKEDSLAYTNSWDGGVERFSGEERITQAGSSIHRANYFGGLVDVKSGI